ncbi:hypothetical protein [Hydrogenophaga sp.]|uniref:hypothetical protein n=1 Tax=Hydrogenophaga sp. TaxID=1904254 RepID=UPI00356537C4
MIATISRLFKVAFQPYLSQRKTASLKDLGSIRRSLLQAVEDCTSVPTQRLRLKIEQAKTPQELWLLRNDAYQVISQRHDQAVAAQRINALLKVFEGSVNPKHLTRIN